MTCIVTDVRYRMSLAVIRELGESGVRVVCCEKDGEAYPLGFYSKFCADIRSLPGDDYIKALYELCRETYEAEGEKPALLAVGAGTLYELSKPEAQERFKAVCGLLAPSKAALDTLSDKLDVAALAKELEIPVPEVYSPDAARFPCVVKPRCGEKFGLAAPERYKIAGSALELGAFREYFRSVTGEEPLIQQCLTGRGIGCCVVAEEGAVRRCICHLRIREYPISGGPSSCCMALRNEIIEDYTARLIARAGFSGPCMAEFKLDGEGKPRLLEVNPRVWGSYPLTRAAGAGFGWEWFRLSWNRGNPEKELPPRNGGFKAGSRMAFASSDLAAAAGYFRNGQKKRALGALCDLVNPAVRDGVFEWRDIMPAVKYYLSLFKRGGK